MGFYGPPQRRAYNVNASRLKRRNVKPLIYFYKGTRRFRRRTPPPPLNNKSRAQGLVHYALAFCTPYLVEYQKVKRLAGQQRMPILGIETDYADGDAGQLKTRLEAFIEQIKK